MRFVERLFEIPKQHQILGRLSRFFLPLKVFLLRAAGARGDSMWLNSTRFSARKALQYIPRSLRQSFSLGGEVNAGTGITLSLAVSFAAIYFSGREALLFQKRDTRVSVVRNTKGHIRTFIISYNTRPISLLFFLHSRSHSFLHEGSQNPYRETVPTVFSGRSRRHLKVRNNNLPTYLPTYFPHTLLIKE